MIRTVIALLLLASPALADVAPGQGMTPLGAISTTNSATVTTPSPGTLIVSGCTAAATVTVENVGQGVVENNCSYAVTVTTAGGSGVVVAAGTQATLTANGTNVVAGAQAAGGPILLHGSGTASYDALVTVTGGGSVAGQGIEQNTAAVNQFVGLDGTAQAQIITMQSAADYVFLEGGQSGFGGTIGCQSATDTNVDCVMAAQGTGGLYFGNGSGLGLQVLDPNAAITDNLIVYGGTASAYPQLSSTQNMNVNVPGADGVFFAEGGVPVAEIGGGAAPSAGVCYVTVGQNNTTSLAKIGTSGTPSNCGIYMTAGGTSSISLGNSEGTILGIVNSSLNTVGDAVGIRAGSTAAPDIIFGTAANLYIGNNIASALSLSATLGYFMIPAMAGKNSATPLNAGAGHPAIYWDSTDLELCVYDTSRHCSPAFTN